VKDYKAIFDAVEATLFKVGSRNVPREKIIAELEPCKHLEGKRLADNEYYRKLVHIAFYSGFRAQTVTDKRPIIDLHFPGYELVAGYGSRELQSILSDARMIRNRLKIQASIENAKRFQAIVREHGSFYDYLRSLPPARSDDELVGIRDNFRRLFKYLGERTAFHFMMDIGIPVIKPDRVIERVFKRLGLVQENMEGDALYIALIQEARKLSQATGYPIRYIDIVFVDYGQAQNTEIGIDRGICLEIDPSCSICGAAKYCDYYALRQKAS
jgi:DNA-3-methyladenine glycosylase I